MSGSTLAGQEEAGRGEDDGGYESTIRTDARFTEVIG